MRDAEDIGEPAFTAPTGPVCIYRAPDLCLLQLALLSPDDTNVTEATELGWHTSMSFPNH